MLQLGAMRHLALSGLDVARHGAGVGRVDLTGPVVIVVGSQPDAEVEVVSAADMRVCVARPGRWVVFDPEPLKAKLARLASGHADGAAADDARPAAARRSA